MTQVIVWGPPDQNTEADERTCTAPVVVFHDATEATLTGFVCRACAAFYGFTDSPHGVHVTPR